MSTKTSQNLQEVQQPNDLPKVLVEEMQIMYNDGLFSPPFFQTPYNFDPAAQTNFEHPVGVSETVPDQLIDLRLMLQRSASGIPVPMRQDGYSLEDYPDIFKMDEFELVEFRENLAHNMQVMKDELHVASKQLEDLENAARIQDQQRNNVVTNQQNSDDKPDEKTTKK